MSTQADNLESASSDNSSSADSEEIEVTFGQKTTKDDAVDPKLLKKMPKINFIVDEKMRKEGRNKMVFKKDDKIYDGFSQRLISNNEDPEISDLLLKEKRSDKNTRRANYLKLQ
jgi:hypothetical protein